MVGGALAMTALLRAASPALAALLGPNAPAGRVWSADLFAFTLADGVTQLNWTSWDSDLTYDGTTYSSKAPWLTRSQWSVTNTMEVASLTLKLMALNGPFAGAAQIKQQIVQGLFDGAAFLLSRAYMTSPGAAGVAGVVALFGGVVGAIDVTQTTAQMTIKAKVNILDQNAPRNLYQVGCNHAFCDYGCGLSRATYTASFTAGSGATPTFIPWSGSPPANAALYQNGTLTMTGGAAAGQRRTIAAAGSSGLTLAYPLFEAPAAGDAFTAFEGCDKTFDSGSGQSCTDRSNTANFRGFPYVPPPNSAY
jgi:uncharacterized phage protein (TIGR02218 family)